MKNILTVLYFCLILGGCMTKQDYVLISDAKTNANAVNAYLSGYSPLVPQLNNTPYSNTVRFDVEADPFLLSSKRIPVIMYLR